jgi:hypothetical protein
MTEPQSNVEIREAESAPGAASDTGGIDALAEWEPKIIAFLCQW